MLTEELGKTDDLAAALSAFMARRYDRCRLIVGNSHTLGEWEKNPQTPGADPIALVAASYRALAQPI